MRLLKRINTVFIVLALVACNEPYNLKDTGKTRTLNYTDEVVQFELAPKDVKVAVQNDVTYTYFQGDRIVTSQGGYDGRLLSGEYTSLYTNKVLREQGMYKNGVKDGEWKKWNDQGQLLEIVTWKDGILHGKTIKYHNGQVAHEFRYKKNELVENKKKEEAAEKEKKASKSEEKQGKEAEKPETEAQPKPTEPK